MKDLSHARLLELVHYDPDTGVFTYKPRPLSSNIRAASWNTSWAGKVCQARNAQGYIVICLLKQTYKAHRLAWLYVHGKWPDHTIDHINRIKDDNRICNLRDVTQTEQMKNWSRINPVSGKYTMFDGVYFYKDRRKYRAVVKANGRVEQVGWFATREEAVVAQKVYRVVTA